MHFSSMTPQGYSYAHFVEGGSSGQRRPPVNICSMRLLVQLLGYYMSRPLTTQQLGLLLV